jgi:putative ABC transport system permease protein
MSSNALAAALPSGAAVPYNSLLLQTDGTAGQLSFDTQLEQAGLPSNTYNIFLDQANLPSVSMFDSEIAQHRMIADIFPVVFVLVTLLVLVGTMARMITNQRTQIGTLRALGITRRAITFHYISYAFILTLCGSVLGMVAGIFALPPLFVPSMSSFYSLPVWQQSFDVSFLLMIVVIVAASVLVTWFSCRSILNEQPAQTLRPKAPKPQKAGFLHKAGILQHLGFIAQYNLRNASRNKLRSVMAIIGTLGCVALISCALSVGDAMRDMKQWQYQIIDGYQNEALLQEGLSLEAAQRLAQHYDGLLVQEQAIEVEFGTSKQLGTLTVIDTSSGLLNFTNSNLEVMELPDDGISITQHQAELLGVQVGDTIRWHLLDSSTRYESVIQSFSRHPSTQGIACLRIVAEQLGLEFSPNTLLTAVAVDGTDTGIEQIQSKAELERGWDDLTEAMNMMILLMTLAAFLLAVMVLYNLALLSFIEMERELATLKVMGLRYATLRALLLTQSIWFSVAGYILGIPCGRALLNMMLAFSGENFDYPTTWHLSSLALSLAFTLGIALLVGLLFSRRLRRIDMVTTLKAIE